MTWWYISGYENLTCIALPAMQSDVVLYDLSFKDNADDLEETVEVTSLDTLSNLLDDDSTFVSIVFSCFWIASLQACRAGAALF